MFVFQNLNFYQNPHILPKILYAVLAYRSAVKFISAYESRKLDLKRYLGLYFIFIVPTFFFAFLKC